MGGRGSGGTAGAGAARFPNTCGAGAGGEGVMAGDGLSTRAGAGGKQAAYGHVAQSFHREGAPGARRHHPQAELRARAPARGRVPGPQAAR